MSALSGLAAALLAAVGQGQLAAYTGVPNAALLGVILFAGLSFFLPLQFLLAGKGKFGVTDWIDLIREVAKTGLQFGLVLLGFGVTGMTVGFAVATAFCLPIILYFLGVRPSLPTRDTMAYVWDYAKFNIPSNVVEKAYTRFDIFLLGWIGLTASVGYYEVALSLAGMTTLISGVVMDGLLSKVSNLDSRERSVSEAIKSTISYTSVLAIPTFIIVVFLGEAIVGTVYGSDYLATVPFLLGIAVYRVIQTQREPLDSAVKGTGHPDAVFRISSLTVAVNFALGIALALTVGAIGVIVATVVAETFRCLLLHRTLRLNDASVPLLPEPRRVQLRSAVAMAVVMASFMYAVPTSQTHQLASVGALGVVTYIGLIIVQDGLARRSIADVGTAVHTLVVDRATGGQTTQ